MACATACFAAVSLPMAANASDTWHPANTEIGYTVHMDHAGPGKTREQVVAELATAKSAREQWDLMYLNAATPGWVRQGTSRTREDALAEVRDMTPAEAKRLAEIYAPG